MRDWTLVVFTILIGAALTSALVFATTQQNPHTLAAKHAWEMTN